MSTNNNNYGPNLTCIIVQLHHALLHVHGGCGPHLMLVVEVINQAVGMVMLLMIEGEEFSKVVPITIILVSHVIAHSVTNTHMQ